MCSARFDGLLLDDALLRPGGAVAHRFAGEQSSGAVTYRAFATRTFAISRSTLERVRYAARRCAKRSPPRSIGARSPSSKAPHQPTGSCPRNLRALATRATGTGGRLDRSGL